VRSSWVRTPGDRPSAPAENPEATGDGLCHAAPVIAPTPPVLPADRMADNTRLVLSLPGGLELRPWSTTDAGALVAASHDPAISRWNLLPTPTEDKARARIGRMRERWERETAAVWAVARGNTDQGAGVLTSTGIGPTAGPRDEHAHGRGIGIAVEAAAAAPDDIAVYVAEADGEVVCAAWLVFRPGTGFASLWGGSTRAEWRGRGIYRALVAVRAALAVSRLVTYLHVDASDDSAPILRRLGMHAVTTTTPYAWTPPGR
jgi:hypothetical protein